MYIYKYTLYKHFLFYTDSESFIYTDFVKQVRLSDMQDTFLCIHRYFKIAIYCIHTWKSVLVSVLLGDH